MRSYLLRVACVALPVLAGGCSLVVGNQTECTADADCAEGAVCREGLCVRPLPPWADGGYYIDAGTLVTDAGEPADAGETPDAAQPEDAGEQPDSGEVADAGEPPDAGESVDAGELPDAGQAVDAGITPDAGAADAGPAVCPETPDCALPECRGILCAPGAHCGASGLCLRDGTTSCRIDQVTGQSACDNSSCLGASCGLGLGSCTAIGVCTHRAKTGCVIDVASGDASCTNPACKGASCGDSQVCTGSACVACGTPCGNALPGCTNGIDCVTGECSAVCQCLGTPSDSWCAGGCVDLRSNGAHCGTCGHACLAGSTCAGGCCGDPSDCEHVITSLCPVSGYECVEEEGARRAKETSCADGLDNDEDTKVDCADEDCSGQACPNAGTCADGICCATPCAGGCESCTAVHGANGVCAPLGAGQTGTGCGGYLCDGSSGTCPSSCTEGTQCASGTCTSGSCQ